MALAPMMTHYVQLKEQYKDVILLYRLGDFYECFFEDAKIVSKALDLVLTGRNCGLEERAPMCGVPAHAIDAYLSKLVQQGFRVAICEQLTEPEKGKMVERDVVRVISAGTVIESDILTSTKNNYLVCVYIDEKKTEVGALSYIDVSTGEFYTIDISGNNLIQKLNDELVRINPVEIICNNKAYLIGGNLAIISTGIVPKFDKVEEWFFDSVNAKKVFTNFFGVSSNTTLEVLENESLIKVCGATLEYLKQTQKRELHHIQIPKVTRINNYMYLDAVTMRNLELVSRMRDGKTVGTLLNCLDYTKTSIGARLLKRTITEPLQSEIAINNRLEAVEELYKNASVRLGISSSLENFADIERICSKLVYGSINPKECIALKLSLSKIPQLKMLLYKCNSTLLNDINSKLSNMEDVVTLLEKTIENDPPLKIKDGGYIKSGFNNTLDEYRNIQENGTTWLSNLQKVEIEETGIKTLKIKYNKVFGYFIEIPTSMTNKVPIRYVRKQTIANNERYITEELKEIEDKILNSQDRALALENEIYEYVKAELMKNLSAIQQVSSAVAELDVYNSFAVASEKNGYTKPNISSKNKSLKIIGCRHPVVEQLLKGTPFIANDVNLNDSDERVMIITGPNMAGKSTYMREVAIATLMAHIGCFVPAKEAIFPIVDRIFTRVGASDDLSFGQSTFMVEMAEVANILNNATENSLLILDEVGRGTSTYDGLSIAWSIMDYLSKNLKAKTLFATHYFELTDLEGMLDGVKNYRVSVKEFNDEIIFLRKIVRGGANRSFGIQVASLAGVPKIVTDKAKEILRKLEQNEHKNLQIVNKEKIDNELCLNNENNSEIIEQLKSIDINNTTPLQALEILTNLTNKINKE